LKDEATFESVLDLMLSLHEVKDAAYKDSWRRRGELVGIFANIARKYDRLVIAIAEDESATTEALPDTAADLALYSLKYLTYLAEVEPEMSASAGHSPDVTRLASGSHSGVIAAAQALRDYERFHGRIPPPTVSDAFDAVCGAFTKLEDILLERVPAADDATKHEWVWALADAATWLLIRLADERPEAFARFKETVRKFDES
jgi:thymidylate synthase